MTGKLSHETIIDFIHFSAILEKLNLAWMHYRRNTTYNISFACFFNMTDHLDIMKQIQRKFKNCSQKRFKMVFLLAAQAVWLTNVAHYHANNNKTISTSIKTRKLWIQYTKTRISWISRISSYIKISKRSFKATKALALTNAKVNQSEKQLYRRSHFVNYVVGRIYFTTRVYSKTKDVGYFLLAHLITFLKKEIVITKCNEPTSNAGRCRMSAGHSQ